MKKQIKQWRIQLANWVWPKDIKVGDDFTVIARVDGNGDKSWLGDRFQCTCVIANMVYGSRYARYGNNKFDYATNVSFPPSVYQLKTLPSIYEPTK